MSHSQFHSIDLFILRHAWLNLWDKRMLLAESTRLLSQAFILSLETARRQSQFTEERAGKFFLVKDLLVASLHIFAWTRSSHVFWKNVFLYLYGFKATRNGNKHPNKTVTVTVMLRWMIQSHSLCSVRVFMFNSNIHYAHTFIFNLLKAKALGTRYIFSPLQLIETRYISLVFPAVEPTQLSLVASISTVLFVNNPDQ